MRTEEMLDIDLNDIDPCAPLLIECWYCGCSRIYHDYAAFIASETPYVIDADGNIACLDCAR